MMKNKILGIVMLLALIFQLAPGIATAHYDESGVHLEKNIHFEEGEINKDLEVSEISYDTALDKSGEHIRGSFAVEHSKYVSPVYKTKKTFSGIASSWSLDFDATLMIRFGQSLAGLGDWRVVGSTREDSPDHGIGKSRNIGEILNAQNGSFVQYKVIFEDADFLREFDIQLSLFTPEKAELSAGISADQAGLGPQIISRSAWRANESYMTWQPEYDEVKAIVIHHTAAEDSRIVGVDPNDMVRNLYYGHAVTYGWGDVGYNYIVDLEGKIYEGRAGGNGVVAGHASGYNPGTIGISVIGDYNVRNVENSQFEAITDLIAYLSYKNKIDPVGTVALKNKIIPTIVGHQDLNATSCPGNTLYGRLGMVRSRVAEKLATYPARNYNLQVLSAESTADLSGGETKKLRVSVKNTGNVALLSRGANALEFRAQSGSFGVKLADFGSSIEPGEIRTIEIEVTAPYVNQGQDIVGDFYLSGGVIAGTKVSFRVSAKTPEYGLKLVAQSPDLVISQGTTGSAWVEIKNIGTTSWNGSENLRISVVGQSSQFFVSGDWVSASNAGGLDNVTVIPGGVARFSFKVNGGVAPGKYQERFRVESDRAMGVIEVNIGATINQGSAVPSQPQNPGSVPDSTPPVASQPLPPTSPSPATDNRADYAAKLVDQSAYPTVARGSAYNMTVKFRNEGKVTWSRDKVRLATDTPRDRDSRFATGSWLSKNRVAFLESSVAPGSLATFVIPLNTDQASGKYKEYFRLVAESVGRFGVSGLYWDIVIKSSFDDFEYVRQSPHLSLAPGQSAAVWIELKNTGTNTWQKGGATPVRLATSRPKDRNSSFYSSNRVSLDNDSVAPGEVGRFSFNITAPQSHGVYKEYFTVVRDGVAWMKDIGIFWQVNVAGESSQPQINTPAPIPTPPSANPSASAGKAIQIASTGDFAVFDGVNLARIASGDASTTVGVSYSGGVYNVTVGDKQYSLDNFVRIVPQASGAILSLPLYSDRPAWNPSLNDNAFEGVIEVRYSKVNKKLWAINELFIEDYLAGVSESIDTFPAEYLKVSSIIQRSYVLHHYRLGGRHKDDFLTLKNSRNGNGDDQIYQGYNFRKRASNIAKAAAETKGEIVTYNGRPVITPYFNQSDGRTRSASEVWNFRQSDYPWLVSVPDPGSVGLPLKGHGVGLSGKGARDLINQGKTYKEVLQYFYQGTDTSKVDESGVNVRVGIYSIND